jgi:hypothetical protein
VSALRDPPGAPEDPVDDVVGSLAQLARAISRASPAQLAEAKLRLARRAMTDGGDLPSLLTAVGVNRSAHHTIAYRTQQPAGSRGAARDGGDRAAGADPGPRAVRDSTSGARVWARFA